MVHDRRAGLGKQNPLLSAADRPLLLAGGHLLVLTAGFEGVHRDCVVLEGYRVAGFAAVSSFVVGEDIIGTLYLSFCYV